MSEELKGTNIYAPIVPGTDEDKYPTHYSRYGKGGFKCVRTLVERDTIPVTDSKCRLCVMSLMKTSFLFGTERTGMTKKWVVLMLGYSAMYVL